MVSAIQNHEAVHERHLQPALDAVVPDIEARIESLTVPHTGQSESAAVTQLRNLPAFQSEPGLDGRARTFWDAEYIGQIRLAGDHSPGGPTDIAERNVVNQMISSICFYAASRTTWPRCTYCR